MGSQAAVLLILTIVGVALFSVLPLIHTLNHVAVK